MKKLWHLILLLLVCLLLLLGTESFAVTAAKDGAPARVVFSFVQPAEGDCVVSVFGYQTTLSLEPLVRVRSGIVSACRRLPQLCGDAVAAFCTRIVEAMT